MRKAFRHTGVLMMVAVVALGLLGAAYTLWYENLNMVTNISTGNLDAAWSFHPWHGSGSELFDGTGTGGKPVVAILTGSEVQVNQGASSILGTGGTGTGASRFTNGNFPTGKPQPTCNGAIANDANGVSTLTLNMLDLYPFAGCEFTINLENPGSVPFHIGIVSQDVQCTSNNCPAGPWANLPWTRGVVAASVPGSLTSDYDQCLAFLNADWQGPNPGQIQYPVSTHANPVQIHHGTPLVCTFMLVLDENWRTGPNSAPAWVSNEGMSFTVTTKYAAYQWNETPNLATPLP